MKIITLNLWGGKVREALTEFLKHTAGNTDVFCFQEMTFPDLAEEIGSILSDFSAFTHLAPVLSRQISTML